MLIVQRIMKKKILNNIYINFTSKTLTISNIDVQNLIKIDKSIYRISLINIYINII